MSKDHTMRKLLINKTLDKQVQQVVKTITANHEKWQTIEQHDYYIAPPDFSKRQEANWGLNSNIVDIDTGDHYFYNKINKPEYKYSIVVHDVKQFALINQMPKLFVFDNFSKHLNNSKKKIKVSFDYDEWNHKFKQAYVLDVDRFFYDWKYASIELYLIFDYMDLWLPTEVRDAIEQSWNAYRSLH